MDRSCVVDAAWGRTYPFHEPPAVASARRRLLARAVGDTLDVSPSWRRNHSCMRAAAVTAVTVLAGALPDPAPPPAAGPPVRVDPAPAPGSFDTVVATAALCSADRLDVAVADIARWLRPGGEVLALDHVLGAGLTAFAQRVFGPLGERAGTTCRLDADVAAALRGGGLEVTDMTRFTARLGGLPVPFLAATARRPPVPSPTAAPSAGEPVR
ncbi:MAG TPA: methyltransferase domain-containing protein [Acidimicrobiales bacterium]|nr:methyltransferase domain-containing protein [Acidimicrobiales bacterium]